MREWKSENHNYNKGFFNIHVHSWKLIPYLWVHKNKLTIVRPRARSDNECVISVISWCTTSGWVFFRGFPTTPHLNMSTSLPIRDRLIHYDLSNNANWKIGLLREIYVTVVITWNHTTKTEVFCKQDYLKGPLRIWR
jgi:hypothetical protein